MQAGSLSWEDPLEEGMATHFKYSFLENPMDRGAWRAAVHRVALDKGDGSQGLQQSIFSFCTVYFQHQKKKKKNQASKRLIYKPK